MPKSAVVMGICTVSALLSLCTGCRTKEKEEDAGKVDAAAPGRVDRQVQISPEAREEATSIFSTRCTPCHGPTGSGDGPTAKTLSPPPRNFHDPAWQAGTTDAHIEQIVRFGGAAVGKSPGMPPNPDLVEKPEVVAALREHIRNLGAPK